MKRSMFILICHFLTDFKPSASFLVPYILYIVCSFLL